MKLGQINELIINRTSKIGLFLRDDEGNEVLLPARYVPILAEPGESLKAFIYTDSEDRLIATTETPLIMANSFAMLEAVGTNAIGAFMNMGLAKDLLVPKKNQLKPIQIGEKHLVWAYVDKLTERLVGTTHLEKILSDRPDDLEPGKEVNLIVWTRHDLGWRVVVNEEYLGIVYHNQSFTKLEEGQQLKGYVNQIREDGRLDILLQKPGVGNIDDAAQKILDKLTKDGGFLPLNDNSSPEEITAQLGMSKKSFKKGVGTLYKQRLITLESGGIRLKN